jgi:hypothetical protein
VVQGTRGTGPIESAHQRSGLIWGPFLSLLVLLMNLTQARDENGLLFGDMHGVDADVLLHLLEAYLYAPTISIPASTQMSCCI